MSETSEKIDKGEVVVNMEPKSQRGITDEVKQKYSQNFEAHALRSIEDFFDKNKFSVPEGPKVMDRLQDNLDYFVANYVLLFVVLCCLPLCVSYPAVLGILACDCIASLLLFSRDRPVHLGETKVSPVVATGVVNAIALILTLWTTGPVFFHLCWCWTWSCRASCCFQRETTPRKGHQNV
mmetsp:Transcript_21808/g.30017  ORF Transcript_21808/g.30017 Transcript_21808/m.30017 type:complete len:180 (+) Transcript_21808:109-648(+)